MDRKEIENKRYICLARVSNPADGSTSTEGQIALLKDFGDRMGMVCVDEIALNGVTGSLPGKREDLDGLLERKRQKNDFDFILLQRLDRLTRGGSGHGFWFEHECIRVGVRIIFVGDDIPEGRYANLIKVSKFEAAQEYAFSVSQRSTQGSQLALEDGRKVTSSRTPFGCWRLYLAADGKPSHIIADLRDGRQQKLDPNSFAVIDTYGQVGGGSMGHYKKQKREKVLLMPGDAAEAAVVREIFDLHFRKGFGGKRIAGILNQRGIRSPQGKKWSQHQVDSIHQQEVYTGISVGNRSSNAIYHERSTKAPKKVPLDAEIQAAAKRIPLRHRPREEWFFQEQPMMKDFLDAELRQLATAEHERIWRQRGDMDRPRRSKSKHQASDYLLTGLLYAKQDGEPLVGSLCGRVGKKVRYYKHRRGNRDYFKGGIFSRMINAKPLEDAVISLVSEILMDVGWIRERIIAVFNAESRKTKPVEELAALQKRREQIKRRTTLIFSTFKEETIADAKEEMDRLNAERRTLDEQIAAAQSATAMKSVDPIAYADAAMAQLQGMAANISEMPTFALRQFLGSIVGRVLVDMETKAVEVQLMLPLEMAQNAEKTMRLVINSGSSTSDETHPIIRVELGRFDCVENRIGNGFKKPCYVCRRAA